MSEVRQTRALRDCGARPAVSDLTSNPGGTVAAVPSLDDARALVLHMSEVLGMRHVFLGRIHPPETHVEMLVAWVGGRFESFSYDLAGSPCDGIASTGICVIPRDAARRFPGDAALAELEVESYAGIVVDGDDGSGAALLVAMGTRPLERPSGLEATLRLFAARARTVIRRIDVEQDREEDGTGRRVSDRARRSREEILAAVVDGGERLLRAEPWTDAASEVLELLGHAARVERAMLYEVEQRQDGRHTFLERVDWSATGSGAVAPPVWDDHVEALLRAEVVDHHVGGEGERKSSRSFLLPIRVGCDLVGVLRLDDPQGRARTVEELDALRAATGVFGAAVERERTARDLRARERILHAVATSAESLIAAASWRDAIEPVLASLGQAIEASRAYLCLGRVDPSGRLISSLVAEWLDAGVPPSDVAAWTDWVEVPEHAEELASGRTLRLLTSRATGAVAEGMRREGTLSEINVPLVYDGALLGYVGFDDCAVERSWSKAEEEALLVAAGLVAGALAIEQGARALESRELILEAVAAAGAILLDAGSWRAGIDEMLAVIGMASGADRAQLYEVVDPAVPGTVSLTHLWARDGDASELANPLWQDYEIQQGALERYEARLPVSQRADEMPEPARSAMECSETLSFTSLPVHVHGRLWGLIGFDDRTNGRRWSSAVNEALRAAAGMLGAAVERTLADEALRASEEQLRQAQKMHAVGRLASGIAHDFNNILGGIAGYGALLAETAEGDAKSYAGEIVKATEHAAEVVRQLLAIGKVPDANPERVDLGQLVASLEGVLRGLGGTRIDLVLSLEPSAPPVLADGAQLRQVVLNLVANAVDAIDGAGTVSVAVERGPEGSSVILAVEDTGIGMDAAAVASAFEPFVTTKAGGHHAGLGLSIVYGIVQGVGGTIAFDSEHGRGTRVVVSLPAAPA